MELSFGKMEKSGMNRFYSRYQEFGLRHLKFEAPIKTSQRCQFDN